MRSTCRTCGKKFEYRPGSSKGIYCSTKCQPRLGDKNPCWRGGVNAIHKLCKLCGKEFITRRSQLKRGRGKYCSKKCYGKATGTRMMGNNKMGSKISFRNKNNPNWQGGISRLPYSEEFDNYLKEKIRERDGYKCRLCGVPQIECNRKLTIHHIDYDKKNCNINNLITLCNKHNSMVNFDREYWTHYFQECVVKMEVMPHDGPTYIPG
jgi:hypothetical protein